MPLHAKIVAGLLAITAAFTLFAFADGIDVSDVVVLLVRVGLLAGFLMGNESVRSLLRGGAGLSLIFGLFQLVMGVLALAVSPLAAIGAIVGGAFAAGGGAYLLWALQNAEVKQWMFRRSLGSIDD